MIFEKRNLGLNVAMYFIYIKNNVFIVKNYIVNPKVVNIKISYMIIFVLYGH